MSKAASKKVNRELVLTGSLPKAIFTLAVPIVINSFIQTMYNLTDTFWLGKLGEANQAAISLVTPVQNVIINFGTGIVTAGSILISQYLGAKKDDEAKDMATHVMLCSLIFSIICAMICFIATPSIVTWLNAEGIVNTYATVYMRIIILDMPFLFLINVFTAVNQSQGNTLPPMLLNLFGVILNMIMDPVFMITFDWGIAGAGLATLLAKVPCGLIAIYSLCNKQNPIHITIKGFKFVKEKVSSIIRIGLPTAIGGSTMQFGFLLMSKNVAEYGTTALASYGIGNKINGLISLPSNAMGSATATIVGLNVGAEQYDRAEKAYKLARNSSVLFLFVGGLVLSSSLVNTAIVSIFSSNPEVIDYAAQFLMIMAICSWTNGVHNSTNGLFQGTGHTMVTMVIEASRIWVFRFATLYICEEFLGLGFASIWYSVVVSNACAAFILWILYKTGLWRKNVVKH